MADDLPGGPGSPDPAPRPQPLDYGTPAPSGSVAGKVFSALTGAFMTVVVVAIVGAGLFPYSIGGVPSSTPEKVHWIPVAIFLALGLGGITGAALIWRRRPLASVSWYSVGALIALGIMGLLEGACYANP